MGIEYEIKILDIDILKTTKMLEDLGYENKGKKQFKRYVYDLQGGNAWLRLRTDGSKTTLTYKNFVSDSVDGMQELEINVGEFEKTNELLELTGMKAKQYQENQRTIFQKGTVQITIDEWPLIPAYLEVEADSTAAVKKCVDELGFKDNKTTSKPTAEVYKGYGLDLNSYKRLSFDIRR